MKHLATVAHEGAPTDASRVLYETDDGGCVDNLSGETRTREEVQAAVELLEVYAENLRTYLHRTCGAHPLLVDLRLNSFELPECDGGYSFCSGTPEFGLSESDGEWTLSVEARYEHDDDRGGQFEKHGYFTVKDGRFCEGYKGNNDLCDANDRGAVEKQLQDWFFTDGG